MGSTIFHQHNTTNTRDVRIRHMLRAAHHLLIHYYLPQLYKKISENLKNFRIFFTMNNTSCTNKSVLLRTCTSSGLSTIRQITGLF